MKTFFNSVRYLGRGIEPDYSILEKRLIDKNLIQIGYLNDFRVMVVGVQDFIEETFRILQENQCALLKDEFYIVE